LLPTYLASPRRQQGAGSATSGSDYSRPFGQQWSQSTVARSCMSYVWRLQASGYRHAGIGCDLLSLGFRPFAARVDSHRAFSLQLTVILPVALSMIGEQFPRVVFLSPPM